MTTDDELPIQIGGYRIVGEIGRGGMGVVYDAWDTKLGRRIALKTVLEEFATSHNKRRFLAGARATAQLKHPAICSVLHVDTDGKRPYMVMPFVPGATLESLGDSGPLGVRDALAIMLEISRAVQYAHEHAVIHRDIKPENIIIDDATARPVLLDFGLARDLNVESSLTGPGGLGTRRYASPEQLSAAIGNVGPESDIYSLGATLVALLIGVSKYRAITNHTLVYRWIQREGEGLRASNDCVWEGVETIVRNCLEFSPRNRYCSASGLADDLESVLAGNEPALEHDKSGADEPEISLGSRSTTTPQVVHAAATCLTACAYLGFVATLAVALIGIRMAPKDMPPLFAGFGVLMAMPILGLSWPFLSAARRIRAQQETSLRNSAIGASGCGVCFLYLGYVSYSHIDRLAGWTASAQGVIWLAAGLMTGFAGPSYKIWLQAVELAEQRRRAATIQSRVRSAYSEIVEFPYCDEATSLSSAIRHHRINSQSDVLLIKQVCDKDSPHQFCFKFDVEHKAAFHASQRCEMDIFVCLIPYDEPILVLDENEVAQLVNLDSNEPEKIHVDMFHLVGPRGEIERMASALSCFPERIFGRTAPSDADAIPEANWHLPSDDNDEDTRWWAPESDNSDLAAAHSAELEESVSGVDFDRLTDCPHCSARVSLTRDYECPACRTLVDKPEADAEQ
jgi:hypothetical protein